MQASAIALLDKPKTSMERDEAAQLIENAASLYNSIASRALDIFKANGQLFGRDLDNWLQAEMEFLHPLHILVSESPEALTVRADVPGFKEKDLKIEVEPRRVTIAGKREARKESKTGKTVYSETCSDQILRVIELPAAVDVKKAKTTVKDGVLELNLPKAEPDKHDEPGPKAVEPPNRPVTAPEGA
jgi:HSP20 family molecular chaperone IbpA